jgi:acyl-CoA synthetase (AMP-forming)/AMP-acid ligase II
MEFSPLSEMVVSELPDRPLVGRAAETLTATEEWGQQLATVLVPRLGCALDLDEVREWAQQRLRSSNTPQVLVVADELPRTDSGKLLRRQVVAQLDRRGSRIP